MRLRARDFSNSCVEYERNRVQGAVGASTDANQKLGIRKQIPMLPMVLEMELKVEAGRQSPSLRPESAP